MRPLLHLLDPRAQRVNVFFAFLVGSVLGALLMRLAGWPLWSATAIALGAMGLPLARSWRATWQREGIALAVLSSLIYLQSFHSIEHVVQWVQYHFLGYPPKLASGLISPLNAEWVHFSWNWMVLLLLGVLWCHGFMRTRRGTGRINVFALGMVLWTAAHTAEHSYLMIRYLDALATLRGQGVDPSFAQGLPGFFGSHGWLSQQELPPAGLFVCQLLPGLVAAPRLDVHFVWNMGEVILLWLAAWGFVAPVRGATGDDARSRTAALAVGS
ncbi:MAG TPA: hypothetical protein VFS21_36430 [Roseiflexaceae bacterium]|nr:hypothetical protein [Roseiflexaceae bacterium]